MRAEQSRAEQSRAEQSRAIDVVKFLMAICVVAIHTQPLQSVNGIGKNLYETTVALSVPFFFMSTGYLVFGKLILPYDCEYNKKKAKKQILKMLRAYFIWSILYLPLAFYGFFSVDKYGIFKSGILYIRNILFQGQNYFSYPLWYLLAAIYASIVFYFLIRNGFQTSRVIWAISISFIISKGTDYLVINQNSFHGFSRLLAVCLAKTFSEGRVFSGIYLMLIGALIQKYSKWINNAMVRYSCIIFVTLFIFDVFIDNVFLRLSVCVAFFIFVQNLKVKKVTDAQSHFLRRMSTVVFYAHMIIFFLWGLIDGKEPSYGFTGFIASLVGTVVLAVIISANRIKNSRLVRELFG